MSNSDHLLVKNVRSEQKRLRQLSDDRLREESFALKYRVLSGERLNPMVGTAFGLVVEASRRTTGLEHFDVQIIGGIELSRLRLAEMKTGEGKTLTATLPMYLFALSGRGAHVATVNDYLAERDADEMGPIYRLLGLSVGVVKAGDDPGQRFEAYRKDITYGTAKEFGFDFLRDRISRMRQNNQPGLTRKQRESGLIMRPLHFGLVDEADSILIDEARTPLIIAMVNEADKKIEDECYRWAAKHSDVFNENVEYKYEHDKRRVKLTAEGIRRLRSLPQNSGTKMVSAHQLYRYMETAIKVNRDFHYEKNYTIKDGEIVIIDEFTGRIAEGRQWQDGIHQAIQAKESVGITSENQQTATITVQTLFRLYPKFAGMTGTAWTSRREFKKVYKKRVVRVPTNKPVQRTQLPSKVLPSVEAKWDAVADEVEKMIDAGRAVLIGTRSIDKSEALAERLRERKIGHQILNAKHLAREADIVALAGQSQRVTVATNMAGRGTDIKLDDIVTEAGGLHVILTEIHEAARIDLQLIGRGSRQGDPGSFRIFVSLDDEILQLGLGPSRYKRLLSKYKGVKKLPDDLFKVFRLAQRKLESRYLVDRMVLLRLDKERHEQHFEMGVDPFLNATAGNR